MKTFFGLLALMALVSSNEAGPTGASPAINYRQSKVDLSVDEVSESLWILSMSIKPLSL